MVRGNVPASLRTLRQAFHGQDRSSTKLGSVHSSSASTKSAPLAGLLAHSAGSAGSQLISTRRTVRVTGRWSGRIWEWFGLMSDPNPIGLGDGMQVAERAQPLAEGAHSLQVKPVRGARLTPSFSINMGSSLSISLSNSRVKIILEIVEREKEKERESYSQEKGRVWWCLVPATLIVLGTDSDQEWEIKTRRRTWRTQTWFIRYVMGRGSINPNGWSL
ncbi:hypothetical protein F2Q69_00059495 [Brassica cretica]|uniref:Uncharacterized protein n=1 Tax=Brassica cretica TaxID=69181 RepID=A0A8S9RTK5_BRACR|nr:hypothetical protein F2Q69_00059495 [Brassica cretica]